MAHFIERVKNDPKFRAEAFKLQDAIRVADEPGTAVQTYFGQNSALELDTREEGWSSEFGVEEREAAEGNGFKQQRTLLESHPRYDEIKVISQSIAFSEAGSGDVKEVTNILNLAYNKSEHRSSNPHEGFRTGDVIDDDTVKAMIEDENVTLIVGEVPDGRGVISDGTMLCCAAFSSGPLAAKADQGSQMRGAIRMMAVRPDYQGLLLGHRLLQKIERTLLKRKCGSVVACVPSTRSTLISWLSRRSYNQIGTAPYPVDAVPFKVNPGAATLRLLLFEKELRSSEREERKKKMLSKLSLTEVLHTEVVPDPSNAKDDEVQSPLVVNMSIEDAAEAALRGLDFKKA